MGHLAPTSLGDCDTVAVEDCWELPVCPEREVDLRGQLRARGRARGRAELPGVCF